MICLYCFRRSLRQRCPPLDRRGPRLRILARVARGRWAGGRRLPSTAPSGKGWGGVKKRGAGRTRSRAEGDSEPPPHAPPHRRPLQQGLGGGRPAGRAGYSIRRMGQGTQCGCEPRPVGPSESRQRAMPDGGPSFAGRRHGTYNGHRFNVDAQNIRPFKAKSASNRPRARATEVFGE